MSDIHNTFIISGDGNTVNFEQNNGSDGNQALEIVLKFVLALVLSPVLIPFLLTVNGYKMLQGGGQNLLGGNYGDE